MAIQLYIQSAQAELRRLGSRWVAWCPRINYASLCLTERIDLSSIRWRHHTPYCCGVTDRDASPRSRSSISEIVNGHRVDVLVINILSSAFNWKTNGEMREWWIEKSEVCCSRVGQIYDRAFSIKSIDLYISHWYADIFSAYRFNLLILMSFAKSKCIIMLRDRLRSRPRRWRKTIK